MVQLSGSWRVELDAVDMPATIAASHRFYCARPVVVLSQSGAAEFTVVGIQVVAFGGTVRGRPAY